MNIDAVIISAIMPMVPGVTFTAAIRDTLNGDYSSGVARIAEAVWWLWVWPPVSAPPWSYSE